MRRGLNLSAGNPLKRLCAGEHTPAPHVSDQSKPAVAACYWRLRAPRFPRGIKAANSRISPVSARLLGRPASARIQTMWDLGVTTST
jgi:hypothetical protein